MVLYLQWRRCQSTWTRPIFRLSPTRHLDSPFSTVSGRIELTLACAKNTPKLTDLKGCCKKSLELLCEGCLNNGRRGFALLRRMMNKPEKFKVNSRNLDLNLDFGFSITANEGKI